MKVFSLYFKIIKKHMGQISIYLVVFLALSILISSNSQVNEISTFAQEKSRVALINQDEDTAIINGLKEYLGKFCEFIDIPAEQEKLQDALFYRDVENIIRIPANFSKDYMDKKSVKIDRTTVPDSSKSIYTDMMINSYLNTAKFYIEANPGISQEDLVAMVKKDMDTETKVEIQSFGVAQKENTKLNNYFNFLAYFFLSSLILAVSTIMLVFNNKNVKRRNLCSPIKQSQINIQLLFGNIVFTLFCWLLMLVFSFTLYGSQLFTKNALLFMINSLIFALTVLSISFLASIIIKNSNMQSAVSNVLSLGLCFLSGVFVPQSLLSDKVLMIASFNPTYWYVKANNTIGMLSNFSWENMLPVVSAMLIQLGFAIAILAIALVIGKRRPREN